MVVAAGFVGASSDFTAQRLDSPIAVCDPLANDPHEAVNFALGTLDDPSLAWDLALDDNGRGCARPKPTKPSARS